MYFGKKILNVYKCINIKELFEIVTFCIATTLLLVYYIYILCYMYIVQSTRDKKDTITVTHQLQNPGKLCLTWNGIKKIINKKKQTVQVILQEGEVNASSCVIIIRTRGAEGEGGRLAAVIHSHSRYRRRGSNPQSGPV